MLPRYTLKPFIISLLLCMLCTPMYSKTMVELGTTGLSLPEKDADKWTGDKIYFGYKDNKQVLWDVIDPSTSKITAVTDDVITSGPYMGSPVMTPKWSESFGVKKIQQVLSFTDTEKAALPALNENITDTVTGAGDTNKTNPTAPMRNLMLHRGFEKASARKKTTAYWLMEPHTEADFKANCVDENGNLGVGSTSLYLGYIARAEIDPSKIAFLQKYNTNKITFDYVPLAEDHNTWQVIWFDKAGGSMTATPDPGVWSEMNNLHIKVTHPAMEKKATQTSMILMDGDNVICYGKIGEPGQSDYYVAMPEDLVADNYEAYVFDESASPKAMGEAYSSGMAHFTVTAEPKDDGEKSSVQITSQPQNQIVTAGEEVIFEVTAKGAVSYQWYVSTSPDGSGTPIAGANKPTLRITGTAEKDGMYYYCVITGADGTTIETSRAKLTVAANADGKTTRTGVSQSAQTDGNTSQPGYDYSRGGQLSGTNSSGSSTVGNTGTNGSNGSTTGSTTGGTGSQGGTNGRNTGANGSGNGSNGNNSNDKKSDKTTIRVNGVTVTVGESTASAGDRSDNDKNNASGAGDSKNSNDEGRNASGSLQDADGASGRSDSLASKAKNIINAILNPSRFMDRYYNYEYLYTGNLARQMAGKLGLLRYADGYEGESADNGIKLDVEGDGKRIIIRGESLLKEEGISLSKLMLLRGSEEILLASCGKEEYEITHVYNPDKDGSYTFRLYNSEGNYAEQQVKITGFHGDYEDADYKYDTGDFFFERLSKALPWLILLLILLIIIACLVMRKIKKNEQESFEKKIVKRMGLD